ncbi:MAG TPA: DUF4199 domain-containing protein, partial [Flavobacterium sp.]|nr:DUF4199 domain-containing protein [Flavobacterium sp.]
MNYYSRNEGAVDLNTSMLIGYASMLVAFSLVFVGIRNYREKYSGGVVSFGKAFKIGIFIVLIASTMYVVSWLICYFFFIPDFLDKYGAQEIERLKTAGATAAELQIKTKEIADFETMYKNPFFNALMTYAEILPVGIIVTLISSLILKRKP